MQFRRRADPDDDLIEGEASVRSRRGRDADQDVEQPPEERSTSDARPKGEHEGSPEPDRPSQATATAGTPAAGFGSRTGERVKSIVVEAEHAAASIRADAEAAAAALLAAAEEDARRIREAAQVDAPSHRPAALRADVEAGAEAHETNDDLDEAEVRTHERDGMASAIKEVELAASSLESSLRRLLALLNSDLLK